MATNFPTSLDNSTSLPYPSSSNFTNAPSLAGLNDNQNDALIATQTKLGIGASTPTSGKFLTGTGTGTSAWANTVPAGTVVGTSDSQTLTNKTLTSPTITSPVITNATISTDLITGYTTSNTGTVYGIPITTGVINTAGTINGASLVASSVATASIADGAITPAKLLAGTGSSWTWQSWTPTWVGITVGNGVIDATYSVVGKIVHIRLTLTFGTTTSITVAFPSFSLPVTAKTAVMPGLMNFIYLDTAVQVYYGSSSLFSGATSVSLTAYNASATYTTESGVSSAIPFTWGSADVIKASGFYEAA